MKCMKISFARYENCVRSRRGFHANALIWFVLISVSACSLVKSEGEREAKTWFDNTFVQCGDGYYTKYDGPPVFTEANMLNEMKSAILEFKNPSFEVRPTNLEEKDKLNGIEWHGAIVISFKSPLRYYQRDKTAWSVWHEGPLLYSDKMRRDLDKLSPYLINFGKVKGKWIIPETGFSKMQCSDVPPSE